MTSAARCWATSSRPRRSSLVEARAAYADGAPVPLPEERNDAEKYRARIARLRQAVTVHERNIEALRKEIGSTR